MADIADRVTLNLSPDLAKEVERILLITDLGSKQELFGRAFTLLRIHVDAAARGLEIRRVDPFDPDDNCEITLPFRVGQ